MSKRFTRSLAAVAAMAELKTHPREEAGNRYLLRRAERLYQELPNELREWLGRLLDGFEQALGMQDAVAISANGEALREFLDRHDPDAPEEEE